MCFGFANLSNNKWDEIFWLLGHRCVHVVRSSSKYRYAHPHNMTNHILCQMHGWYMRLQSNTAEIRLSDGKGHFDCATCFLSKYHNNNNKKNNNQKFWDTNLHLLGLFYWNTILVLLILYSSRSCWCWLIPRCSAFIDNDTLIAIYWAFCKLHAAHHHMNNGNSLQNYCLIMVRWIHL